MVSFLSRSLVIFFTIATNLSYMPEVSSCTIQEGLHESILVQTPEGLKAIAILNVNDCVLSFDSEHNSISEDTITHIASFLIPSGITLYLDKTIIISAPKQKFYCQRNGQEFWINACDIESGDAILSQAKSFKTIHAVEPHQDTFKVYTISTRDHHNFFVGNIEPILTHNLAIELGLLWGMPIIIEIATPTITAICFWIANQLFHTKKHSSIIPGTPNDNDWNHYLKKPEHNFNDKDPKRIWEIVEKMLLAAIAREELQEGIKFTLQEETEIGLLEVVGKVVQGIARIGTMYIKETKK